VQTQHYVPGLSVLNYIAQRLTGDLGELGLDVGW
jgi:hypothetical protein